MCGCQVVPGVCLSAAAWVDVETAAAAVRSVYRDGASAYLYWHCSHGCLKDFTEMKLPLNKLQLDDVKRGIAMVQGAFPARLGAMYVIGAPMLFRAALCMAKPFLGPKSKLIERIVLLDSAKDLHQFVKSDTLDNALGDRSREAWAAWLDMNLEHMKPGFS